VEIIVVLSQFLKPQSCLSNHMARQHLFVLQSEHLTTKSTASQDIADIAGGHHDAGQSTANYGARCSPVAPHRGSDHEIATARLKQPLTLAGGAGREEDRPFPKNNGR
jgi:hypothetical protein